MVPLTHHILTALNLTQVTHCFPHAHIYVKDCGEIGIQVNKYEIHRLRAGSVGSWVVPEQAHIYVSLLGYLVPHHHPLNQLTHLLHVHLKLCSRVLLCGKEKENRY